MFLYSAWCSLSLPTRIALAEKFGIVKRGSTEVSDNTIKSDGYLIKEVEEALNVDALQKYLETEETDMKVLWTLLVNKIEGKVVEVPVIQEIGTNTTPNATVEFVAPSQEPKKAGRPKKTK